MRSFQATATEPPEISVVVPLFDEQENLPALHDRVGRALRGLGVSYEVVFVDDGSRDATPWILDGLFAADPRVAVVRLSRNFGHQPAVSAGLRYARGRAVVVMDGDLQDPPEVVPGLVARWRAGFDVVYAVRRDRKENAFKRFGYFAFYRLLRAVGEIDIPLDSGDFCLMDRRVVDALEALPEQARFVRGLRTFVGFRQAGLEYERAARGAGKPKYTLRALVRLALDGLVSFSGYPLRLASYVGLAMACGSAGMLAWVVHDAVVNQTAPRGWASVMTTVLFIGSVQLIVLGIIGEYVRLIFLEAKRRPSFVVDAYRSHAAEGEAESRFGFGGWVAHDRHVVPGRRRRKHGRGHPRRPGRPGPAAPVVGGAVAADARAAGPAGRPPAGAGA